MFGCYLSFRECIYLQVCACFPAPHFSSRDHVPVDALYLKTSCISGRSCGLLIPMQSKTSSCRKCLAFVVSPIFWFLFTSNSIASLQLVAPFSTSCSKLEVNPDLKNPGSPLKNKREAQPFNSRLTSSQPTNQHVTPGAPSQLWPYVQEITSSKPPFTLRHSQSQSEDFPDHLTKK